MSCQGKWIRPLKDLGDVAPVFQKKWKEEGKVVKAELLLTSMGVYEAFLNGQRVSDYVLAPGWTVYEKQLQYQVYDVTDLLDDENKLEVTVGKGWFRSGMPGVWQEFPGKVERTLRPCGLFAELTLTMEDGRKQMIPSDNSWQCTGSPVVYSEIYHGETFDARITPKDWQPVEEFDWSTDILIPQIGDEIKEKERIAVREIIKTPKGETVLDFGQLLTGYVEFTLEAKAGDKIRILCGEVLDAQGNFYNENYRSAKSEIVYICKDG
jgi:alpha-L-rhamnosidase